MKGILDPRGRDPRERYYTPRQVVAHHLDTTTIDLDGVFCEPFAGDGRYGMLRAGGTFGPIVLGDLDPRGPHVIRRSWQLTLAAGLGTMKACFAPRLVVVTNPAFSLAAPLVRACADLGVPVHMSLLLPTSFLEATKDRKDIFNPVNLLEPTHVTYVGRVQFEGPAIEARRALDLKVAKAAMQYAYVDWEFPRQPGPCITSWDKAPATGTKATKHTETLA